jgi:hypothetical protein
MNQNSITLTADLFDRGFDHPMLVSHAQVIEGTLAEDAQIAKKNGDAAAIALTSRRLAASKEHHAAHRVSLPVLEKAELEYRQAVARRLRADAAVSQGTLSAATAAKDEAERIAAVAAERHWANAMPALRSAVSSPLHRIAALAVDEDAKRRAQLLESNLSYVHGLWSAYSQSDTAARAAEDGAKLTGVHEAWLPVVDVMGRADFERISKGETRPSGTGDRWEKPTLADFEKCLAARRGGLAAARRAAQQRIESLHPQVA